MDLVFEHHLTPRDAMAFARASKRCRDMACRLTVFMRLWKAGGRNDILATLRAGRPQALVPHARQLVQSWPYLPFLVCLFRGIGHNGLERDDVELALPCCRQREDSASWASFFHWNTVLDGLPHCANRPASVDQPSNVVGFAVCGESYSPSITALLPVGYYRADGSLAKWITHVRCKVRASTSTLNLVFIDRFASAVCSSTLCHSTGDRLYLLCARASRMPIGVCNPLLHVCPNNVFRAMS